jgi:hypothetical protein
MLGHDGNAQPLDKRQILLRPYRSIFSGVSFRDDDTQKSAKNCQPIGIEKSCLAHCPAGIRIQCTYVLVIFRLLHRRATTR